ncbi:MAG: hypothetical protein R3F30_15985 [Planctomycetota bacterium]
MIDFNTEPSRYKHWKLSFDGPVARLEMAVDPDHPFREGYELKLNSYDLAVDIELQDAVRRLRFEHPEVTACVVTSAWDRVFCATTSGCWPSPATRSKSTSQVHQRRRGCSSRTPAVSRASGSWPRQRRDGRRRLRVAIACDDLPRRRQRLDGGPARGPAAGRAARHGRPDPPRRQAQDPARPRRRVLDAGRGRARQEGQEVEALVDDTWPKSRFADKVAERARAVAEATTPRGGECIAWQPVERQETETGFAQSLRRGRARRRAAGPP